MSSKWTAADVPDQTGRVAIVTGSNTGLGYETALVLADRGARVVLAVRDTEKGKAAAARIVGASPRADVTVQPLDLGSLQSIRTAAEELKAAYPRIDLLINNAGVMYVSPRQTTKDGFEMQFGTNHLGHFALTGLLLENLLPVDGSRVVTVSSVGHRIRAAIHFDDLQWERSYNRVAAYGQAKLANLMFTYELQRRLGGHNEPTIALAAHPGVSDTELGATPARAAAAAVSTRSRRGPAMGALATLRAATDPGAHGGQYYGPDGLGEFERSPESRSVEQAVARPGHPGPALDGVRRAHRRHLPGVVVRSVEEHQRVVAELITARPAVAVGLGDALGLVLADDVVAPLSLPGFDNSAMDGYAVVAEDIADASDANPVKLPVAEDIPAGRTDALTLAPGTAHRIMTGAPLPAGATAVIPVEATDGATDVVTIRASASTRPARPTRGRGRHRGHHGAARGPGAHPCRTRAGRGARPR